MMKQTKEMKNGPSVSLTSETTAAAVAGSSAAASFSAKMREPTAAAASARTCSSSASAWNEQHTSRLPPWTRSLRKNTAHHEPQMKSDEKTTAKSMFASTLPTLGAAYCSAPGSARPAHAPITVQSAAHR